jgi:nucleoside-diphosphate-sugar epimerase
MTIHHNHPPLHVLVTGGAGFLGINLTRALLCRGFQVTSFDLLCHDYPDTRERIGHEIGDIRDKVALNKAMRKGVTHVVHTAAALPLYSEKDILTTDIDGTRNVLEVSQEAGVFRVVHISSTAVYGVPDHHPLVEDDPLKGVGPYGIAKVEAENCCLEARERGLCVPILRPKSFVGPERLGVFALLYDWALDRRHFPVLGPGDNRYQLLDVEDLCEAIILTLTLPSEQANSTFNVGSGHFGTIREDYQAVLDAAGFGKKIRSIPAGPAITILRLLEKLKLSPLYPWIYETVGKDSFVSIDKAKTHLGWSPRYSNTDALLRNFEWYRANLSQFSGQGGLTHRVPWKQGALSLAKLFF